MNFLFMLHKRCTIHTIRDMNQFVPPIKYENKEKMGRLESFQPSVIIYFNMNIFVQYERTVQIQDSI